MTSHSLLPEYTTPAALAGHFGVSERTLKEKLREIGAFAKAGRKMVLFPEHVEQFKEAMKCPSKSIGAGKSGTTEVPFLEGDYAALQAQRTKRPRKGSRQTSKQKHGEVISMDRGRM